MFCGLPAQPLPLYETGRGWLVAIEGSRQRYTPHLLAEGHQVSPQSECASLRDEGMGPSSYGGYLWSGARMCTASGISV